MKKIKIIWMALCVCGFGLLLSGCGSKEHTGIKMAGEEIEMPAKGKETSGVGWSLKNKDGDYVLTLDGANLKGSIEDASVPALEVDGDLAIVLQKNTENTIQGNDCGILVENGCLTIRGQGSLHVMADNIGISYAHIAEENKLILEKGDIRVTSGNIGMQISVLEMNSGTVSVSGDFYGIFGGYEGTQRAGMTVSDGELSVEGDYAGVYCEQVHILGGESVFTGYEGGSTGLLGTNIEVNLQNGSLELTGQQAAIAAQESAQNDVAITLGEHTVVEEEGASLQQTSYQITIESDSGDYQEEYEVFSFTGGEELLFDTENEQCQNALKSLHFNRG